jgi:ribose transport system permease protein
MEFAQSPIILRSSASAMRATLRGARWLTVLAGVLLLGLVFSRLSPAFLEFQNLKNIAVQSSVTGVMAVGMTFVIMTAGIDISVGAILYLTAALVGELAASHASGASAILAYVVGIALGTALGLMNGLVTTSLRINPLVTTLATLNIYRGLALHINQANITLVPDSARYFGIGTLASVPVPVLTMLAVGTICALILRFTRFGRYVLAIGVSERSARETHLPVNKVQVAVYGIAGACAGLGGLILLGRVGAVQSDMGIGIEFTVITAAVLGGTSLAGGRGSIVGTLLGAILLVMIDNGLNLMNASPYVYDIVRGGVLVSAILIQGLPIGRQLRVWPPYLKPWLRQPKKAAPEN